MPPTNREIAATSIFPNSFKLASGCSSLSLAISPRLSLRSCSPVVRWMKRISSTCRTAAETVEQDKAWYADLDPNTNEPKTIAQMFFTVYYAEKGDQMLHHFQGKIDIGTGNGGIISQLKM